MLWGSGWYNAQVVENKGGYLINYLLEDGEQDTQKSVPVACIRKPKKTMKKKRTIWRRTRGATRRPTARGGSPLNRPTPLSYPIGQRPPPVALFLF